MTHVELLSSMLLPLLQILEENARALAAGAKLPYAGAAGKVSLPDASQTSAARQTMPRDHA